MTDDKNKEYVELVEDSATIRVELDEVIRPRYSAIKKIVKRLFKQKPAFFKFAVDMQYYQGGYPKAESPAKIKPFAEKLSHLVMIYEATEKLENLNTFLAQYGIKVARLESAENPYLAPITFDEKAQTLWDNNIGRDAKTPADAIRILLAEALDVQKEICETADKVSVEAAAKAESDFGLKKGSFMKAVGVKVADIKKGEGDAKLAALDENITNLEQAIEPLRLK